MNFNIHFVLFHIIIKIEIKNNIDLLDIIIIINITNINNIDIFHKIIKNKY